MSAFHDAKQEVLTQLKKAFGKAYTPTPADLDIPPDSSKGNIAFPCFTVAKGMRRSPVEIAREIAAKIAPAHFIKKIEAQGPYVNFFFDEGTFGQAVLDEIHDKKETYGQVAVGNGRRIMIEYANLNTHKETHIGHLRNCLVGHTLVNLLKAADYDVIPVCYIGDLGTHVAKCLWALKKFHAGESDPKPGTRGAFLGKIYSEASKVVEDTPEIKTEISAITQELEHGRGPMVTLWKKTRTWSIKELEVLFEELGLPMKEWYFESQFVKGTKRIIQGMIKKGIVTQSEGAWIVDLEEEKLGVNLLIKSDGTLLYNARDIGLALRKEKDYSPDRSLIVVDVRQSLVLQQLFATLRRMGFHKELVHVAYEFVTLKEGAMASRKGNIVRYEDVRDRMIEYAMQETGKRHADWSEEQIQSVSRTLAFAALRFAMIRQSLERPIIFDIEESLSFDGVTGPYLLYTVARIHSLLRKAENRSSVLKTASLSLPIERDILFLLSRYPETILMSLQDYQVSKIAQYLFDLAKLFAAFYQEVSVLQASDETVREARLRLLEGVEQVLVNGLSLLGIKTVEEM